MQPSKLLEKDVQKIILNICRLIGLTVWRQNTGAVPAVYKGKQRFIKYGLKGQADITGLLPDGRRLEIEVKRPGGKQSAVQKHFQTMIERHGGIYIVADSIDAFVQGIKDHLPEHMTKKLPGV